MSWLLIDTSTRGKVRAGLLNPECTHLEEKDGRSHLLLSILFQDIGLEAIQRSEGICVVAGPGSFSAVRGGVLVANILARYFSLPLAEVSVDATLDLQKLALQCSQAKIPVVAFVQPIYDAEPNITKMPV